ncbi:MAG: nucleoside recognition domain-containing protein [Dissulfurispiraceae bacterium]
MPESLKNAFLRSLKPTFNVSLVMLEVFIPLSLLTLLLRQMGVLEYLAPLFAPLMLLIGLPGEAAITLLVGFTNTIYAALATASVMDLTARQITILGVVLGISHSLFVETGILTNLRMATVRIALFRIAVAFGAGIALNIIMPDMGGAAAHRYVPGEAFSWMTAIIQVGTTSLRIVGIIFAITFGYELVNLWKGVSKMSERTCFLSVTVGMSDRAVVPWIIGFTVGITYGAALLYQLAEKRPLSHKDACLITVFLCLAHAVIEDTLLFVVVGGDVAWIFMTRVLLAVLVVRILATADIYKHFLWIGLPHEHAHS